MPDDKIHCRVTIMPVGGETLQPWWEWYCSCGDQSQFLTADEALSRSHAHYVNDSRHDHENTRLFIDLGPIRAI